MKNVVTALSMVLLIYVFSSSAEGFEGDDLFIELLVNAECKGKEFVHYV